ncbi:pre-peptidase C-terminal domain-containing protein [Plectonema cf. radiosum LEGE 06105]|uniref:Pre-peptidase C-terminal domain-containing protein n=1 Tax=Plectonema cf. radiosum LEGE 06105 TaxID=945769 RepID=A0A8J7FFJ7_9CYAN|nr:pre-peptidase C-terminal domain-containing protein [Plectonema radiosum]MBE9216534.1 pre-peptidase C-terminal domain-containing protein [Plectonema cf. radiosum LEGE 06105]
MVQVSLSTSTNYDGELNALLEDQGTALTVSFSLDEPAPEGGLKVYVDSDVEQIVNRLDLPGFGGNPIVENINPSLLGTNFDNSGFYLTIDEGATSASFTINVFDNEEPDTFQPETFDGLVEAVFQLKTQEQVDSQDLGDVGNLSDYTIDSNAATSSVLFADSESQLAEQSQPPTTPEPPASGLPLVSLNTGPDYLVEEDGTVSAHVFNITGGTIPEGGIVVGVKADNLGEFDLDAIEVGNGGEVVNVREDGFDIRLTDFTTLVNLPVAADGEAEGVETASFSLEAGDGYEVNEDLSGGEFTLVDTRAEVPANFSEPNDIISLASKIEISSDNPEVTINETVKFDIGNRYQNEDGSFTYVDASEDVDFYKFDLKAGDAIAFDIDAGAGFDDNLSISEVNAIGFLPSAPDVTLNVYDAQGNIVTYSDQGAGPGELFATAFDPYIEFRAPQDGTYYLGVAAFPNGLENRRVTFPDANLGYDPFVPASGSGEDFGVDFPNFGQYELNISLNPDNLVQLPKRNRSNNNPPNTVDLAQPGEPTVSLNFLDVTLTPFTDEVISDGLVENLDDRGSVLALILTTEGEIPEEGIVVTVNSDIYLRDYFSENSLFTTPFSPGAELIDVVTDDSGIETGFQLRIFEAATYVAFNAKNRYYDGSLENEVDSPETATFFLEAGEGYGVSPSNSQITTTFYDSLEQVPEPSVIPDVSMTISETVLIESEGTETTLNFSLSEAPPEEGVVVYVKGAEGLLPQFGVLNAQVTGGVFPLANGGVTGFYFKITEQEASITLPVFADPFDEGLQSYSFALQETPLYTINGDASEVNFTIADTPDSLLEVSLSSDSGVLVELENAVGLLTFNLTAFPEAEGVTVTVDAPNLSEFDVDALTVTGGEIAAITDTGFSLNITDATATVELPLLSDGEVEGLRTATFSLVEGESYRTRFDVSEAIITLVDIPEQVPSPTEESDSNDTIAQAVDLNLNPENSNATVRARLSSLEPNEDFFTDIKDPTEDVDLYSFNLKAGDTVKIDVDSIPFESAKFPGIEQRLDSELRLFDADGNELASVNNTAAPGQEFSRDPYLEFTASESSTYYVGISQLGNRDYDPLVDNNLTRGSGWIFPEIGVFFGEYDLNVSLTPGNVPEQPTTQPVFGSLEGDTIEVEGSNGLIFAGSSDDLIDASISSTGSNRIYGGNGNDTFILGSGDSFARSFGDRLIGGAGDDKFFAMSGGDNIITGGAGADQFWIATAEIPDSANIITDFTLGEDVLGIAGLGIGFDDLSITQQEDNTLIAANGSDLAILQGIGAASLNADNFAFG